MSKPVGHPPADDATPWGRLSALTVAVALVHAIVLNGGLPVWQTGLRGDDPAAMDAMADGDTARQEGGRAEPGQDAERPAPIARSQVRWIELVPPPSPAPPAPPPPATASVPAPAPAVDTPADEPDPPPAVATADDGANAAVRTAPADGGLPQVPQSLSDADPMQRFLPSDIDEAAMSGQAASPTDSQNLRPDAAPTAAVGSPAPGESQVALPPAVPAPPATLNYQVSGRAKGFNYQASGNLQWQPGDGIYEARFRVSAFLMGSREQGSQGRLDAQGIHPQRFADRSRRERVAELDLDTQQIRFAHGGQQALQAGTQDRLTVALQLGALLNARPQGYPPGSTIRLPVTDTARVELWDFEVGPSQTLETGMGNMPVVVLSRQSRRPGDRQVEIWLAPGLNHLPARVRISEANGDHIDQLLESKE